jgi:rhodanese-related sulfurtransferase
MIDQIAPADFARWIASVAQSHPLERAVVLDVREPHELQWASLAPGAEQHQFHWIAIPMGEIPSRLGELEPAQPIACLCHHGVRSMQVARFLVSNGFGEVCNIAGGIDAWSLQLDPAVARY